MTFELKLNKPNRKISDMTIGEVVDIIRNVVFWEIHKQINSHTGRYDFQKGYFVGDRPPFNQNDVICGNTLDING